MANNQTPTPVSSPEGLKLLITVVNRVKSEYYADLIQSHGANLQCFVSAKGTGGSEFLDLMGLQDDRKSAIFSIVKADKAPEILGLLEERFKTIRNGKGIAFTIPMSSLIGVQVYRFLADKRDTGGLF
ncbi:MAG: hypothetical protein J6112_06640 [Clostridia bacterium]|nr:hypothetical protein [Clostridia bacterium]